MLPFQREILALFLPLRRYSPLGFWNKSIKSLDVRRNLRDNIRLSDLALLAVITGPINVPSRNLRGKVNLFSYLLIIWYIYNRTWYIVKHLREKFLEHVKMKRNYWNLTMINTMENFSNLNKSLNLISTNLQGKNLRVEYL